MIHCWQCGVEPLDVVNVQSFDDPEPVWIPALWPAADHEHAVGAPSPQALIDEGHRILHRILTS